MNGKPLLLALVLVAAVAALLFCLSGVGGFSWEKGADVAGRDAEAEVGAVGEVSDEEEVGEVFPGNVRELAGGGSERLAAAAERAVVNARLKDMQRRDDEGLLVETMPDGHQSIHLQGRFQHVTSLAEGADGKMVPVCGAYVPVEEREGADE